MSFEAQLPRTFAVTADGKYTLTVASIGIALTVDRLRRERHELIGELTATCPLPGAQTVAGTLLVGTFNLSSLTTRRTTAKLLAERSFADDLPWALWLEELCQRTLVAERAGTPAIDLRDVVVSPDAAEDYRFAGFSLPRRHPAIIFADGGTLKSYLALLKIGSLARAGLKVGLFDWELAADDHHRRLRQLFGPDLPPVKYVRCERALVHEVDRLRRIVRDEGLQYVAFDSVAFACDGPPEAAEAAAGYYRAVRQLGEIGSLHVAHVTKGDTGDQRPFGSTFWFNGCRACWFLKRSEGGADSAEVDLGVFPRKANLGPLGAAFGLRATFSEDRLRFAKVDVATLDDLAPKLQLWQRVRSVVVRSGPLTVHAIAEHLDAKVDSVKKAVERGEGKTFTRVTGADGVFRWAALDRAHQGAA